MLGNGAVPRMVAVVPRNLFERKPAPKTGHDDLALCGGQMLQGSHRRRRIEPVHVALDKPLPDLLTSLMVRVMMTR
jgi:hypothetical protein